MGRTLEQRDRPARRTSRATLLVGALVLAAPAAARGDEGGGDAAPEAAGRIPRAPPSPEAKSPVAGPVLTVAGAAALVAGASVAAVGAGTPACRGEACNDRLRFLLGGGLTGALLGGLGMGVGLRLWTAELGEAPGNVHGPRASSAMMTGGIALVAAGTGALGVGFVGSFAGGYDRDDPPRARYGLPHPSQPILLVSGAALLAVGVPLLELGARRPLTRSAASGPGIHLGPNGIVIGGGF
jgi:hypothetical protein